MESQLRVQRGGRGDPQLLLLHGLGATGDVWNGWRSSLDRAWPGRWLAPDLPGHGGSPPLPAYTFDGLASAVAEVVDQDSPTVVLGHSLGGVVGLALAQRYSRYARLSGLASKSSGPTTSSSGPRPWPPSHRPGSPPATRRPPATFGSPA